MLLGLSGCGDVPSPPAGELGDASAPATLRCARYSVTPSADNATASFLAAMQAASSDPSKDVQTTAGGQVRVYLPAGVYALDPIQVVSDVRFEIEPGAVLRPRQGLDPKGGSWGLFTLGDLNTPTRNVTFTAGDGCGGPGTAVPAGASPYKPTNTNFRGNDPTRTPYQTRGMANSPIPLNSYWTQAVAGMWVLDIDPRATQADWQVSGFYIRHAFDIWIGHVFSIQNAEQNLTGGELTGVTSKNSVLMIKPPDNSPYDPNRPRANWVMPQRLHVDWHYNILSPSGQGPNQIRGCVDCSFQHIFSHGGTALRVETDGIKTTCSMGCSCTGPNGQGFQTFSTVDGLAVDHVEGVQGNRVLQLTPHCLPNGTVAATNIRGTEMYDVVALAGTEPGATSGSFQQVTIGGVQGCGGSQAQYAMPQINAYSLGASVDVFAMASDATAWTTVGGTWTWPLPPAPGGLSGGNLSSAAGSPTIRNPQACPPPWTL